MTQKVTTITPRKGERFYRQEGKAGMYQIVLPFLTTQKPMLKYLPCNYGESYGLFKNNYAEFYFYEKNFRRTAEEVLKVSRNDIPETWKTDILIFDAKLTELCWRMVSVSLTILSDEELRERYDELLAVDQEMWAALIFIDSFDSGVDQEVIARTKGTYHFSDDEVHTLLTPETPAFVTKWEIALAKLVNGNRSRESLKRDFFWYAIDYSHFGELTDKFIDEEIARKHVPTFASPRTAQESILKKHKLNTNPLQFFQNLAVWRDERKRLNYTGCYGLMKILREVFRRQSLPLELVNALLPQQVDDLFSGHVTRDQLELQWKGGTFHYVSPEGDFLYAFGADSDRFWLQFKRVLVEGEEEMTELKGMVASRGVVSGRVRIIFDPHSKEARIEEGDILVTSMTRPEFLPLMKKAVAVVTDEGGISCHAAIVSRELGIPCIIGTRNATKILRDGDVVEGDGNQGVVKILKKAGVHS